MDYAIQLLVIIAGTLWLGQWLVNTFHWHPVVLVLALFLGIIMGIGTLRYRMQEDVQQDEARKSGPNAPKPQSRSDDFHAGPHAAKKATPPPDADDTDQTD